MSKQFLEQPRGGRANINPTSASYNRKGHEYNKLKWLNLSMQVQTDSYLNLSYWFRRSTSYSHYCFMTRWAAEEEEMKTKMNHDCYATNM
jgi:hypothetical protein